MSALNSNQSNIITKNQMYDFYRKFYLE
jgi:hypothetical protein